VTGAGGPDDAPGADAIEIGDYCRKIEAHLCALNGGHLIRIAGPTFDRVRGWAARGIPLAVVRRGIDRFVERYTARGPKRRPVLLDFCEADVLDLFDEWRRAVGVRVTAEGALERDGAARGARSLPAHLERVIARLTALRSGPGVPRAWSEQLDGAVRDLDQVRAGARNLRGDARRQVLERLAAIDRALLAAGRARCAPDDLARLEREAAEQLRPFEARMPRDAFLEAREAAIERLLRESLGLPLIVPLV